MVLKFMHYLYHSVQVYNVLPLTSSCNVRCLFCSHHQNPKEVQIKRVPPLTLEQIEDLLDFMDSHRKIVIGESVTLITEGEPFSHPQFFNCLELIRKKFPQTLIQLTTNGSYFDEKNVKKLINYEPLEVNLSLNTANLNLRKRLMGDRKAEIACKAPLLLKEYNLRYHGSVVAMPQLTGWDDLYQTLKYLSDNGALTVRVFKPGFTKYSPDFLHLSHEVIKELEEKISIWRKSLCPVTLEPPHLMDIEAEVTGVIKNSPADLAGITAGDVICEINGKKPFSRVEAFKMLQKKGKYKLVLKRKEQRLEKILDIKGDKSGLVFDYDISKKQIDSIQKEISKYDSKNALIITSFLGCNVIKAGLKKGKVKARVIPVQNNFFGGNIQCAGLLVVKDIKKSILEYLQENSVPDLVLLPSIPFNLQEKDLTGTGWWKIKDIIDCPVVLV